MKHFCRQLTGFLIMWGTVILALMVVGQFN